jgi:putative inorganic carbon (hco3(-)) transporter
VDASAIDFAPRLNLRLGRLDALVVVFVGVLWARVSDVGIAEHDLPSLTVPFAIALILLACAQRLARGERIDASTFRRMWPMAPYVLIVAGSALWATEPDLSLTALGDLIKNVLIFWVLAELITDTRTLRWCCLILTLVAAALSAISLYQASTQTFASNYAGFAQASLRQIVGSEHLYRLSGPVGDPNYYALILLVVVPLGLCLVRTTRTRIGQLAIVAMVMMICTGVVLTYSRGGILVLALAIALTLLRTGVRLLVLVAAGLAVALAPAPVWDRMGTLLDPLQDDSVALRIGAQEVALQMFLDHPFVGVGAANYPVLYQEYSRDLGVPAVATQFFPHNLYLQVAAETGALGLLTFLPIVIGALVAVERTRRAAAPGEWRDIVSGVEIALLCYLVASVMLHASYPRYLWILLALTAAATAKAGQWRTS